MVNRIGKGNSAAASEKQRADGDKQPKLKGLERRRKSGRRVAKRRNTEVIEENEPVAEGPQRVSLAGDARELIRQSYNELFGAFPALEAVIIDSGRVAERRKTLAAMRQMLSILHRQEERVKFLEELEQECEADTMGIERSRVIAEALTELFAEFSSEPWVEAITQIKAGKTTA